MILTTNKHKLSERMQVPLPATSLAAPNLGRLCANGIHQHLQESRGAALVVVALIPSLATSRIKQYLTLKNPYFSYVTVKKCEYLFVCLYQTLSYSIK